MIIPAIPTALFFLAIALLLIFMHFRLERPHASKESTYALSLVGALFVFYFYFTWLKFGMMLSDSGTVLYVPFRILAGKTLYLDISWGYGPLEPYFNALMYRIFGEHTNILYAEAIALHAILLVSAWRLCIALECRHRAMSALALILTLCICDLRMELPYTFSMYYGTLVTISMLLFLPYWANSRSSKWTICLGVLAGICGLTKQNVGFFTCLGTGIFLVLDMYWIYPTLNHRERLKQLFIFIVTAGTIPGVVYGYFVWRDPSTLFSSIIPLQYVSYHHKSYYLSLLSDIQASAGSLKSALSLIPMHICILAGLFTGAYELFKHRRTKEWTLPQRTYLCLFLISFCLLQTIAIQFHAVFIAPLTILLLLAKPAAPTDFNNRRIAFRWFVAFLLFAGCMRMMYAFRWNNTKAAKLSAPHISFYDSDEIISDTESICDIINSRKKTGDTLFTISLPTSMFYTITGLDSPVAEHFACFPGLHSKEGELDLLQRMESNPPRFIVSHGTFAEHFGRSFFNMEGRKKLFNNKNHDDVLIFGVDYYEALWKHVSDNYDKIAETKHWSLYEITR